MEIVGIKEVYFEEKNNFNYKIMYSISKETLYEKLVVIKNESVSKEKKLDIESIRKKLSKIEKILNKFDTNYISKTILDGTEFKIMIVYDDGYVKKIVGKNKFPDGYSKFVSLVSGE